jgi:hypothetical protein
VDGRSGMGGAAVTDHDRILGICLSHRLCPKCSRGYMSRKRGFKVRCPNPDCFPSGKVIEGWVRGSRRFTVLIVRYTRLAFHIGHTTLGRPPADGTLYAWVRSS